MTTNALETFPIVNQLDGRFAQAAPSRKPLATELESTEVDECSRFRGFLQRICNTFSHRLSIQASFPRIHRKAKNAAGSRSEPHFAFRPNGAVRASRRRIRQLPASPRRVVLPLIQVLSPLPIPRNRSGTVARRYNYQRAFRRVSKSAPRRSFLKEA